MRIPEIYVLVSGDNDVDYFLNVGAVDSLICVYIGLFIILACDNEIDDSLDICTVYNAVTVYVAFDCFGLCHNTFYIYITESNVLI